MTEDELRALAGECLMVGIPGAELDPDSARLLRTEAIANVILFSRNTPDPEATAGLTASLQAAGGPMLIAIDQEGGSVQRLTRGATPLPSAMALGAAGPEAAGRVAEVCARELRAVGVNLNLAPVVDVNVNPTNPVIGVRSFGDSPALVAACGRAQVEAFQAAGVLAAAKHFPGHGDTQVDSHLALPVLQHDRQRLEAVELVPFRELADLVAVVMAGHLAVPALDPSGRPATQSRPILEGLLRRELGFEGLVCGDAMEMAGAGGQEPGERAVRAFEAGCDLVLLGTPGEYQREVARALREAVSSGRVPEARLRRSARRVRGLKRRLARLGPPPPLNVVGGAPHLEAVAEVARAAVTLVRDSGLLPLAGGRVAALAFTGGRPNLAEEERAEDLFLAACRRRGFAVVEPSRARDFDALVVGARRLSRDPAQAAAVRKLAAVRPLVLVALREPYDLGLVPEARALVAAYGDEEPLVEAALDVIGGRLRAVGRLPVAVP